MKTATPELIALLNGSQQFNMADLLTITLNNGGVLRYAGADIPLSWGGNTFVPFRFKRGNTRVVIGVEVDSLNLDFLVGAEDMISGVPYPRFVQNGGFDGASVKLERAFLSSWSAPIVGVLWMFSGRMAEVRPTRTETKVVVKSSLELLNVQMPRNLYQPRCGFTLYDQGCGVSKAAFKATSVVAAGATRTSIPCSLAHMDDWFTRGVISFTSGVNAGVTRTVKGYAPGIVGLALPLAEPPAAGDTFDVWPGCDKTLETCEGKYANKSKFRGFPYVPVPETAY